MNWIYIWSITLFYLFWHFYLKLFYIYLIGTIIRDYIYSKRSWLVVSLICLFLCCLCRSNGVLNFGFIAYFLLKEQLNRCHIEKKYYDELNSVFKYIKFLFKKYRLGLSLNTNLLFLAKVTVSFVSIGSAFVLYQYYIYTQFCLAQNSQTRIPNKLIEFAREQDYVIINDINLPKWCNTTMFSYNSIQNKYWNVGFLTYWNFRQIPNFILASPIIVLCLLALKHYFYSLKNRKHLFNMLCLVSLKEQIQSSRFIQNENLFPFAIHLIVLLFSSVFFMHVQVKKMKSITKCLN